MYQHSQTTGDTPASGGRPSNQKIDEFLARRLEIILDPNSPLSSAPHNIISVDDIKNAYPPLTIKDVADHGVKAKVQAKVEAPILRPHTIHYLNLSPIVKKPKRKKTRTKSTAPESAEPDEPEPEERQSPDVPAVSESLPPSSIPQPTPSSSHVTASPVHGKGDQRAHSQTPPIASPSSLPLASSEPPTQHPASTLESTQAATPHALVPTQPATPSTTPDDGTSILTERSAVARKRTRSGSDQASMERKSKKANVDTDG